MLSVIRYLQQFQDLYTEEGRKSVKICTYIPGQHQVAMAAAAANQLASQAPNNTTQTSNATVSANANIQDQKQAKVAIPLRVTTVRLCLKLFRTYSSLTLSKIIFLRAGHYQSALSFCSQFG